MLEKLTYQQRFYFISGSFIVLLILSYSLAIKPTLELIKNHKTLKEKYETIAEAPVKLKTMQRQLDKINSTYFSTFTNNTQLSQDYLLEVLNEIVSTNKVQITNYPGEHSFTNGNLDVTTHIITIKGSFNSLLKTLYNFENSYKSFKIASVKFYSELNRKTKLKQLYMELYIQQINNDKLK